ncbi:MAG TPA: hypothetical protein VFP84_12440 [Kofleriaceae bacterium]|nr:hypothetical protein [Kofleriaceae bacterium]
MRKGTVKAGQNMWLGIGVVVATGFATLAAASTPPWSVTPPPGWDDVSAAAAEEPAVQQQKQRFAAEGATMEIASYVGPSDGRLTVTFLRAPDLLDVRAFARSIRHSMLETTAGSDQSYVVHNDGNALIVDEVIAAPPRTLRLRLLAGSDGSHLVGIHGVCHGPDEACRAALQSLSIDRTHFQPLASPASQGGGFSEGFAQGEENGEAWAKRFGPVAFLGLLFMLWWYERAKKRASAAGSR